VICCYCKLRGVLVVFNDGTELLQHKTSEHDYQRKPRYRPKRRDVTLNEVRRLQERRLSLRSIARILHTTHQTIRQRLRGGA